MTIVIIDYGAGNLRSVQKAFELACKELKLRNNVIISNNPEDLKTASRIILPGVGAFSDCKQGIMDIEGMIENLEESIIKRKLPFLGICVGMHLLASIGYENGITEGFDWIKAEVVPFENIDKPIPHMGWNDLKIMSDHPILENINTGDHFYFVHSFFIKGCKESNILATFDYGDSIPAIIGAENIIGTQFHPEKSQKAGNQLIKNFISWNI